MNRWLWGAGALLLASCVPPTSVVLDPADGLDVGDALDARDTSDVLDAADAGDVLDAADAGDGEVIDTGVKLDAMVCDAAQRPAPSCNGATSVPRLVSPLSTSWVTGPHVTFRWEAPCSGSVELEFCATRACGATVPGGGPQTGAEATLDMQMVGTHYWRLRNMTTGDVSGVWEFTVAPSNNETFSQAVLGSNSDFNGDGYSDLAVAAPAADTSHGRVYVYRGSGTGTSGSPSAVIAANDAAGTGFGAAVATAGDVNGDGLADLLVGEPGDGVPGGRVHLFLGSSTVFSTTPSATIFSPSPTSGGAFGASVAGVGDVNGDGYADFVVGEPGAGSGAGRAWLFLGNPLFASATSTPISLDPGDAAARDFGRSAAGVSDTNDDGYDDILVGAPGTDGGTGAAFVFLGGPGSLQCAPPAPYKIPGYHPDARAGYAVTSACDYNNDGLGDVVLGEPGMSSDGLNGAVLLWTAGWPASVFRDPLEYPFPNTQAMPSQLGWSISCAGDIDGNGQREIAAGAPGVFPGGAVVVLGSTGAAGSSGLVTLQGNLNEQFGAAVSQWLDLNGDGRAELVVGAPGTSSGNGRVYVYPGGMGTLDEVVPQQINGASGEAFGTALN